MESEDRAAELVSVVLLVLLHDRLHHLLRLDADLRDIFSNTAKSPTLAAAAASRLRSIAGAKSVGKPKGNAV